MQPNALKGLAKFPTISNGLRQEGIWHKTLPNLLCRCLKAFAVATPEWEQLKEEDKKSTIALKSGLVVIPETLVQDFLLQIYRYYKSYYKSTWGLAK